MEFFIRGNGIAFAPRLAQSLLDSFNRLHESAIQIKPNRSQQGGFSMTIHADDLSVATDRKLQIVETR